LKGWMNCARFCKNIPNRACSKGCFLGTVNVVPLSCLRFVYINIYLGKLIPQQFKKDKEALAEHAYGKQGYSYLFFLFKKEEVNKLLSSSEFG